MVQPVTQKQRASLSRKYILRIARLILPFLGVPITKAVLDSIATASFSDVVALRSQYRRFAAQAAANQMQWPSIPPDSQVPPIRPYETTDWRKAVAKAFHEDDVADEPTPVDRAGVARLLVRADLHGRNAERNTMVAIAVNDDEIAGWARVDPIPPTCPLCRITISRGPVYTSAQAAGGDGNTYHGGCTCSIVLVRKGQENSWPGRDQYLAERALYRKARGKPKVYRQLVRQANKDVGPGVTKQAVDQAAGIQKESD